MYVCVCVCMYEKQAADCFTHLLTYSRTHLLIYSRYQKCERCGKQDQSVQETSPCIQHFGSQIVCSSCKISGFEDCSAQHRNAQHSDADKPEVIHVNISSKVVNPSPQPAAIPQRRVQCTVCSVMLAADSPTLIHQIHEHVKACLLTLAPLPKNGKTPVCMYVCVCVCVCMCVCIYMYMCVCVCVCVHSENLKEANLSILCQNLNTRSRSH